MIRSWSRAASAAMAIFHSNRKEMYTVTRTRKTIRPWIAFFEIWVPHVGPTSCSLMRSGEMPATAARAVRTSSPTRCCWGGGDVMAVGVALTEGPGAGAPADADADALALGEGDAVA